MRLLTHLLQLLAMVVFSSASFGADGFASLFGSHLAQTGYTAAGGSIYPFSGYSNSSVSNNPFMAQALPETKLPNFNPGYSSPLETLPMGTNMRVLLLGQTGSGKSTFLNMAANYLLHGNFGRLLELQKMLKVIIPTKFLTPNVPGFSHSENNVEQQGKSQTSKPKAYKLGFDDRSITFIDTPGMGDTAGLERDEKNLEKILEKAAKGGELSGIILFFNGAETRDNTTKEYSFSKLIGSIPDVALKNMIVVLTNVRKDSCNFPLERIRELGVSEDRIFYMQNSVLASDPQTWKDADTLNHLIMDWEDSMKTLSNIALKLTSTSNDISNEFKRMYELRNGVKKEFHKVIVTFSNMQETQNVIAAHQSKYDLENAVAEDFKDYAKKATVKTRKFVEHPNMPYSTVCTVHHTICHFNCSLQETHMVGDRIFIGCAAFGNSHGGSRCSTCSQKGARCSFENHYHGRGQIEEIEETLQDQLDEYKRCYEQASANAQNAQIDLGSAQGAFKHMQDTIDSFAKEVESKLEELKQICKGYNFVAELQATIKIIKQAASHYTSVEAVNSANNFVATLEIVAERLTEQGFAEGVTSNSKECSGFGCQIEAKELDDMRSRSWMARLKGNFERLKHKNKQNM